MEIYPLLYFKTIAETGNLTRAAENLMISPPALSSALKRLERDLGVTLFDRVGRNLVLNQYGEAYLPYAKKILRLTAQGNDLMRQMRNERGKHLCVGDMTKVFASHMISEFLEQHPDITLRRVYVNPVDVGSIDLTQEFDFVIGSTNGIFRADLQSLRLRGGQSVVAIMNNGNPLAARKSIALEELTEQPMIAYASGMPGRKMLEEIFAEAAKEPTVIYEGNSPHAMVPALERNLGLFLQPAHTTKFNMSYYDNCVCVPVTGCTYRANTSLFWDPARPQSAAAKLFCRFCEEFCRTSNVVELGE